MPADYLANAMQADAVAAVRAGLEGDVVFHGSADFEFETGSEQHAGGADVPGFSDFIDFARPLANQFEWQAQFESLAASLVLDTHHSSNLTTQEEAGQQEKYGESLSWFWYLWLLRPQPAGGGG